MGKEERDDELEKFAKDPRASVLDRFVRKVFSEMLKEQKEQAQKEAEDAAKKQPQDILSTLGL